MLHDDASRLEAKLDQLAGEGRKLRRTLVVCTAAICFVLAGGHDAGAVLFGVALVGACAYSLLKILTSAGDYLVARRESRMMANLREFRRSRGESAE